MVLGLKDNPTKEYKAFMSKNEVNVLGWILGIIIGSGLGYLLFITIRAFLALK